MAKTRTLVLYNTSVPYLVTPEFEEWFAMCIPYAQRVGPLNVPGNVLDALLPCRTDTNIVYYTFPPFPTIKRIA